MLSLSNACAVGCRHSVSGRQAFALWLKQSESKAVSNGIRAVEADVVTDPRAINNVFKKFYSSLYTSGHCVDMEMCNLFLQNLALPSLDHLHILKREKTHLSCRV